ncbi:hypothetical protein JTF06_12160 [Desemzia sp. RIT804]|uniref:hypothetical protein n=1 Tax=Desemzia sp. RIT 804 TaxID=2810209 RepID=UPI00194F88F5|nr:hypothetical protein [Desemzia sp. RIT 804]MBM6615640.1 hypothetical protein [Desemzia sp. RIT 804]
MAETTEQYRNRINQLKTDIENEPYIKQMRENIAEGISTTGNRQADIEIRQDILEDDFVAVQQDASSASPSGAEVAVARAGFNTLDERLTTKEQEVNAQLAQIAINPKTYGAIGDGKSHPLSDYFPTLADAKFVYPFVTSLNDEIDYAAIQKTLNIAFDNNYRVDISKGNFLVNRPVLIYGDSHDYSDKSTIIRGVGRGVTKIIKTTNSVFSILDNSAAPYNVHSQNIDSVFVIVNELTRNGTPITNPWSNESVAKKVFVEHLTVEGRAPLEVTNGIYALGVMFCKFFEIEYIGTTKAFVTRRYNCYSTYANQELKTISAGFEFLSDIGGNTTMLFENCHLNGLNGVGYNVKGRATFINCSIDGGALTPFKFNNSHSILTACHFESPLARGLIEADNSSYIILDDCNMEIQRTATPSFKAINNSRIFIRNGSLGLANRPGFPIKTPGRLLDSDKTSRIVLNELSFREESYEITSHYSISESEKKVLINRNRRSTPYNKYIYYVGSAVNESNYSKLSVVDENEMLNLSVDSNNGAWAIVFRTPISIDGYSKIYMRADLEFANGGSNAYDVSLALINTLTPDGTVSKGTPINALRKDTWFYNAENKEFYVDVNDVYGTYYVEVRLSNVSKTKIKELSLLK